MSELDVGFYIIRYVGAPIRFNLIDQPETSILKSMITSIQLLKANSIYANDDIRHFEEKGIEISAWPFASGYLNIKTEAGSNIYPISVDSKGKRLIKAYEIGLPTNSKWVQLESTFWLARSNNLELTLRPFIPSNEWYLKDNKFYAVVRGANIGSEYKIYIIPEKPWDNQITELSGTVSSDCTIETYIPTMIGKGWFAITDNQSLQAWLLIQIGKPDTHFSKSEFINVRENSYNLPDILNLLKPINHNIRELCCFLQTVKLSKEACIPEEYDPINEKIYNIVQSEESKDIISVILCPSWDSKHATIKNINHDNGKAVLNIDGQEYLVKILIKENTVDIQWEEYSSPCICSCCQKVMTQAIWYMHQCQFPSNRGLRVLSKKLSAELFVDWLTAINLVEISVIRNISKNPSTLPKDLGYLLTQLQNAFRNKPNDVSIDPNTWVHNTFYWWKFLFNLVNGNDSKRLDWILIWGSLEVYQLRWTPLFGQESLQVKV